MSLSVTFRKTENGYEVRDGQVVLGEVIRERRSTDSRIAGTRLRRPGKGATEWSAAVPAEDAPGMRGRRLLIERGLHWSTRVWELEEWRGQRWDTRAEAAAALVNWHDHPEKRGNLAVNLCPGCGATDCTPEACPAQAKATR